MANTIGAEISASTPPAFFGEVVGQVPQRPQQRHVHGELHGVIPVLPMVLEESGESDLFGKLKQHQLQQKDGPDLRQRSPPAAGGRGKCSRTEDGERQQRRSDWNGEERDQISTHRDPPAHTAPSKINNAVSLRGPARRLNTS
jgi:hypothetical protein